MKYIVLLHGLGSNKYLMKPLEFFLTKSFPDYNIINLDFPSFFSEVCHIINNVLLQLCSKIDHPTEIVFVGHSLGGLISMEVSKVFVHTCDNIMCITLGTPYNGTTLANIFRTIIPKSDKYLPILKELSRDLHSNKSTNIPHHIIIGTKKINIFDPIYWITSSMLCRQMYHDGVVDVRENDFDIIINKQIYYVQTDHIGMIFDAKVFNVINNIINQVDVIPKKNI